MEIKLKICFDMQGKKADISYTQEQLANIIQEIIQEETDAKVYVEIIKE